MMIHIKTHLETNNGYIPALTKMLNEITSLDQGQRLMYDYFGCNFPGTNLSARKPTFKVDWIENPA
jgi:hypothetical protein